MVPYFIGGVPDELHSCASGCSIVVSTIADEDGCIILWCVPIMAEASLTMEGYLAGHASVGKVEPHIAV